MSQEHNPHEYKYRELIANTLQGEETASRSHSSRELFGVMIDFDLRLGAPYFTGRKLYPRGVWGELAAFLKGATDVHGFRQEGCNYWDSWADDHGYLGPIYGAQWRYWGDTHDKEHGRDQISELLLEARDNPSSRRLIVTAWNPDEMHYMALPCCHYSFQVNIAGPYIDILVNMRSLDLMVGFPSDVILYDMLLRLFANELAKTPRFLKFSLGSCHIYDNHRENALAYLGRDIYAPPSVHTRSMRVDSYDPSQISLVQYKHDAPLEFAINV